jgi:NADPH-dependent 2,4-dienoyl-CoA reductase/sulfur reductase-like enzyme
LNSRTDSYGGKIENRLRLATQVFEAVRSIDSLGIVGVRLSVSDWPLSDDDELTSIIAMIEPFVDYVSVTAGAQGTIGRQVADFFSKPGYLLDLAEGVKQLTTKPVIAAGHLADAALAQDVVASGRADLVGFARGLIADPDWPTKVRTGRASDVRACIYCNHCLGRVDAGATIGCIYNPVTGRESRADPAVSDAPRSSVSDKAPHVLVVGAGPGGAQAALTLDELGMTVTLAERSDSVGGMVRLAAMVPERQIFRDVLDYYSRALDRSRVRVLLNTEVRGPDGIGEEAFDAILLATGADLTSSGPDVPIEIPYLRADEVIADATALPGRTALVVVKEGGAAGPGAAEVLAANGVEAYVVTEREGVGWLLPPANRASLQERLIDDPMIHVFGFTRVLTVESTGAARTEALRPWVRPLEGSFDFVVFSRPGSPDLRLDETCRAAGFENVSSIGDLVAPRNIFYAVREGFDIAQSLALTLLSPGETATGRMTPAGQ